MILKNHSPIMKLWLIPLVLLLILANGGFAQAAPLDPAGDIDTSFDTDGISLSNFATVYSFAAARAAARQSTGRIVLAGESVDNGQHHFALLRLTTSGLQDPTWGNGGEAKLAVGSSDLINDIAIQADDKVVAVGFSSLAVNVFTIMRYQADGALDMAFGGNNTGYITVDFQGVNSPLQRANAVAIQDDGKIVVAGYRRDNDAGGDDVALVRLNTNGTLDTTFGGDGKVTTGYQPSTGSDQALDVLIVGTGATRKILVGGRTKPTGDNPQNMLLIRYNNDGTLDTSFDGDGIKVHDIPGNTCWPQGFACGGESIRAMALQPDGKIVATGGWESYQQFPSTSGATDTDMITVRFNADGSLDTGFGGTNATDSPNGGPGYVITSVARGYYTDIGFSIAVEPDGQIVSLGYTDQSEDFPAYVPPDYNFYYNQNFLIQRLNANGSRDSGFGPSPAGTFFQPGTMVPAGVVVIDLSEEGKTYDIGQAVVLQPDGKIVGAGRRTFQDAAISDTYFGAVRLNTNGTVDYTYGPDKNTTGSLNGTPDGTPDGYFYAQMLGGSIDVTNGVAQQSNGKIVLAGYTNIGSSQSRFGLARLNTDGALDSTFSGDGLVTAGAPGMVTHSGNAVAIDSTTQKIVVTGESSSGVGAPSLTTMRFNTDGSLDTSFSGDGIATNSWGSNANTAYAVAVQPNGKILVGGSVSDSSGNWDWLLVRYNADGSLDTSFDGDGMLRRDIGTNQNFDYIQAIVVQPDGNILVGGYSSSSSGALQGSVFALARFSSTGVVDSTFTTPATNTAGDEAASTPIPGGGVLTRLSAANQAYAGDQIRGLALMADGRIVAAGKALNSLGYNTFALARYMPNGRLDTSFSGDGLQTHNVAADTMDEIMGIVLQHDDKIVAFGNALFLNAGSADVKLARFNWDDGSLDTTYATNGYVLTNISGYDRPVGGVIIPSGMVGAGKTIAGANPGSADFASLRYQGDPPPKVPGAPDLTDASDSGRFNNDNLTNDDTPSFSGTCETGETVILRLDGAVTSPLSRAICRSGAYIVTSAVDVPDGTHTFSVFARNSYGDSAPVGSLSVVIDTVALPPNITAPAAGSTILPNPSISGNGVETTADVAVTRAGNAVCSDRADASGVWSCNSVLGPGSYTLSVRQTDIAGNTSNAATRSFNIKAPTTTVLTSSGDSTVYGQPVTFTASVTSGYGIPDGTVQFVVDSSSPISVTLSAAGTAPLTRSNLSVGAHSVAANYQGATLYFPSSGVPLTQTVNKADSAVTITSSANPSVVGQSVTLTAQVTAVAPGAGLPTGTVIFKDAGVTIGTQTLNGAGQAAFTSAALAVGTHAITAVYNGDGNFNSSPIASFSQTVDRASTTTAITADTPDPSVVGQPITFNYTVSVTSPGAGSLTGDVTVSDGTNSCIASVAAGSCAITLVTPSTSSFTASYSGDANFKASSSSPPTAHITNKASTTTTITSHTPATSVVGQPVVVSYVVNVAAPGSGTPTGNVTIGDGINSCTASVSAGSCTITFTSAGTKNLAALYAGDSTFNGSTSASPTVHIANKAATITNMAVATSNPSVVGQPVAVSYSVQVSAPGAGSPTGNVIVSDGTNSCTASVSAGTCTMIPASPGTAALVATYSGDVNFSGSASAAENHSIKRADTLTTITAHTPDPSLIGESVTISYTVEVVAPGSGTPTGSVTVSDGTQTCTGSVAAGSCTIAFARLGSSHLTATYAGDGSFTGSVSTAATHVVAKPATTTTITSDLSSSSVVGQAVTIAYTVTVNAPGSGTPTGNVTVSDGTNSCTGTAAAGQCSVIFTSAGARNLVATYAGDDDLEGSSSDPAASHLVVPANTTTAIVTSLSPAVFGQSITFTATVAAVAPGAGLPSGAVLFKDGAVTLGSSTLNASGQASFGTSSLAVGAHTITAEYAGDANFQASSSATNQVIDQAASRVDLVSSSTQPVVGQSVIFTATVTAIAPGGGLPSGMLTFKDGATTLGTGTLDAAGQATFSTSSLAVGAHTITADYPGDSSFLNHQSAALDVQVGKADTTVGLVSSHNPAVLGDSVTFTATVAAVAPGAGLPSGAVTFKDGAVTLGSVTVDAGGQASFSTSALAVGAHSVSAVYAGDASFGATTAMITQTVARADSTTSLNLSLTSSSFGQPVSFTATVTPPPGLSMPTGMVVFKDSGTAFASATLDGAGHAVVTTAELASGSHVITVEYGGDTNFNASQSTSSNLTVAKTTTTTSIASSVNPSIYGQLVSFSATVTRSVGVAIPAGSVTFKADATILGVVALDSTGVASFASSDLEAGSRVITAEYSGDANWEASTSLTLAQEVRPSADMMVSNRASTSRMNGGGTLAYTVVVTNSGPLEAHNVMLSVSLPAGGSLDTRPAGCSATSTTVECSLGTVAKGAVISQSLSLTISSDLADGSVLISRATVTSDTPDGNMANNDSQASTLVGRSRVYMPLFMHVQPAPVQAPDLVVTRIAAGPRSIEIVIKNQGTIAVNSGFWVDLYVAPNPIPDRPNQLWSDGRSKQGAVWGIHDVTLAPGAELRLRLNDAYYVSQYSQIKQLAVGTPIYVQVDSANAATSYGAIQEADELGTGPYNNISSTTVVATARSVTALATVPAADFDELALPARAQVPTPRKPDANP